MPGDVSSESDAITSRTIGRYLETLSSSDPTPGGGSVAGVIGALGAGLALMVISLTRAETEDAVQTLQQARILLTERQRRFTALAEQDEAAYQSYREAAAMPKSTPEEKSERKSAMQQALKHAATVPLKTAEAAVELSKELGPVRQFGSPHLQSDAQIAALCASTCFEAARINVKVNIAMIKDQEWVAQMSDRLETMEKRLQQALDDHC